MTLVFILFVIAALMLLGSAIWFFTQARGQEMEEDIQVRLRVTGSDETLAGAPQRSIRNPALRAVCHLFWRTGSEIAPAAVLRLLLGVLIMGVLVGVLGRLWIGLALIVLVLLLGYAVLAQRAVSRRLRIIHQLPGYLENVIRVLAAGNTLEESLSQAARESPDPIRPLFASIGRQVRLGAPLEQVLSESGEIYKLRDLRVMAMAASINRKYGGSMRGVLKSLIVVIRQRATAAQELRALTAETRLSAAILAGITVFLFVYIFFANRPYYMGMIAAPGGKQLLIGSGVMVLLGFVVLWRMLKSINENDG